MNERKAELRELWHAFDRAREGFIIDVTRGAGIRIFKPVEGACFEATMALRGRERQVVTLLYGLKDGKPRNVSQAASELELSPSWIRRLKKRGLECLRRPEVLERMQIENVFGGVY